MDRFRLLSILSPRDSARMALRFPHTALHILRDCAPRFAPPAFPRRLGLFLTGRCNFACPMCAARGARNAAHGGDMPFEVVEKVLAECSRHHPVVDLIGGEPLLYPRLVEAVALASQRNVLAAVTTNGLDLGQHAGALVAAGLPLLQISLDGWDAPSQAARGLVADSFERLREGVLAVREARGNRPFPIIRILTTITRVNHQHLDRIQTAAASLGAEYWGISNYFYLNRDAQESQQAFAAREGLTGSPAAHAIPGDVYLTPAQAGKLESCLERVHKQGRRHHLRTAYAWNIDVEAYYSTRQVSRSSGCDLPYTRLDIHPDGRMAVCVTGQHIGQVGRESIAGAWRGPLMARYRDLYERTRPMPMCFRCCGLSQNVTFQDHRDRIAPPLPGKPPA